MKKFLYLPRVIMYMNMMPAMTIKANTIRPIFPLRLSSFISQIRNPTNGTRKIKKKIILGVLSIIKKTMVCNCIKILKLKTHAGLRCHILSNEVLFQILVVPRNGDHAGIICTILKLRNKNLPPQFGSCII